VNLANEAGTEYTGAQMGPIYFLYSVPSKIAMLERIDLSFYKSSLIRSYRYRLEVPQGSGLANNKSLTEWSDWTTDEYESFASAINPAISFQFKDTTSETYRNHIPYNNEVLSWNKVLPISSRDDKSKTLADSSITDISDHSAIRVQDHSAGSDRMPDQITDTEPVVPTDRYGNSPVHLAVLSDDVKLLNSLIDKESCS